MKKVVQLYVPTSFRQEVFAGKMAVLEKIKAVFAASSQLNDDERKYVMQVFKYQDQLLNFMKHRNIKVGFQQFNIHQKDKLFDEKLVTFLQNNLYKKADLILANEHEKDYFANFLKDFETFYLAFSDKSVVEKVVIEVFEMYYQDWFDCTEHTRIGIGPDWKLLLNAQKIRWRSIKKVG